MGGNLGDVMTSQPLKHDERRVGHFICLPIANSRSDRSRGRPLHTAEKSMVVGEVASWVAGEANVLCKAFYIVDLTYDLFDSPSIKCKMQVNVFLVHESLLILDAMPKCEPKCKE